MRRATSRLAVAHDGFTLLEIMIAVFVAAVLLSVARFYECLNLDSGQPGIKGKRRKNRNLVPINSEYDLCSCGKDGASRAPLTAKASRDDIVRAQGGNFIGLAVEF